MKRTTRPPATTDKPSVSFRTTLLGAGKTAVGFEIPDELVEQLGHGRRRRSSSPSAATPTRARSP